MNKIKLFKKVWNAIHDIYTDVGNFMYRCIMFIVLLQALMFFVPDIYIHPFYLSFLLWWMVHPIISKIKFRLYN